MNPWTSLLTAQAEWVPAMARMAWSDPFEATRKMATIQRAALDNLQESTEQAVHLGRKMIDVWVSTLDHLESQRTA